MSTSLAVLHVQGQPPAEVERALTDIFVREERPVVLRIEGTYSAVLERTTDPDLDAAYRYLILRPHPASAWSPVLELGNRTIDLDVELSRALAGCSVVTTFVYGDVVSGYLVARAGAEIDRYTSDPTYFIPEAADGEEPAGETALPLPAGVEDERGHPERFADLLPPGTAPEDFARVVLRPGWWEERDAAASGQPADGAEDDLVDEVDRMRCIALAFELWGPDEYPFAADPGEVPNRVAGPAVALAFQ
jgi:hypothetical protein